MKLTYKIAVNYSTVEFEVDSTELKDRYDEIKTAVKVLTAVAMTDDGKPSKVATSAKTTKKSEVSENQRRWLRVHGYKDKDIDTITSKQAYAIIAEAKKNEEAEEELW